MTAGGTASLSLHLVDGIGQIAAADWDACAGEANPFLSHAFLAALETSGAASAAAGWAPHHLLARDDKGRLVGCAPMYVKNHSQGEYVFDHGWAEAYARAGGHYYPKLQVAVPFTPVPGPRFLVHRQAPWAETVQALAAGAIETARQLGLSSLHVTFCTEAEWTLLGQAGLLQRTGEQFHWENRGYASFADFLATLASRKRKALRKEREEVAASGLEIEVRAGREITEAHWDAMFAFYLDTGSRKWGHPYLNRESFRALAAGMAEQMVMILARRGGRFIAGALNFRGADTLYGRYWGCAEDHRFLHFELCYYQAIDYAIAHGLKRVEAGAQGPHKLARGYLPKTTYSLHWIGDAGLRRAVAHYLDRERAAVAEDIALLDAHGPYRQGAPSLGSPETEEQD